MRALVTGGCGFIGTNLIKRLSNNNHKEYCENIVVSIDDYSTGSGDNEIECNGVQYFGGDISKVTDYSNIIDDCDIIFHLAAKARIQPSFETPTEYFQSNAAGTQNILEWARKNGNIPVVYAGSSSKHGDIYSNPYTHLQSGKVNNYVRCILNCIIYLLRYVDFIMFTDHTNLQRVSIVQSLVYLKVCIKRINYSQLQVMENREEILLT